MKIRQTKELCIYNFFNGLAIFNLKTYRCSVLNDTASSIWNFCRIPRKLNQISKFLAKRYRITLSKAKKDVLALVHQLKKRELVIYRKSL